jgi:replicative DNA helicase
MEKYKTLESKNIELATELDVVRLMLKSDKFLATYSDHISPFLFREQLKPLVEVTLTYWKNYRKIIPMTAMVQELSFKVGTELTEEKKEGLFQTLEQIIKDPKAPEYTEGVIADFIRLQRYENAVVATFDVIKEVNKNPDKLDKLDDIPRIINKASQPFEIRKPSFLLQGLDERTDHRTKIKTGEIAFEGFGLGIPTVDVYRAPAYGLLRGEIGIIVAATGRGKSVALTHVGITSAFRGKKVVYFSLELPEEMLLNRADAMISMTEIGQIIENRLSVRQEILEKLEMFPVAEVVFHEIRGSGCTVLTLKNELERLKQQWNFVPDVIIVDYMDLMRPFERVKEGGWKEQQVITEELRAMGGEYGCAVWTASQGNRGAARKNNEGEMLDDTDTAESYNKLFAADWVLTLNRTKDMMAMPEPKPLVINIVKNRTGIPNKYIGILTDFGKMQFYCGDYDMSQQAMEKKALESGAFVKNK